MASAKRHADDGDGGPSGSAMQAAPESRMDARPKVKKTRATPTPGIIYISRLPPGMTPQKVKHLMSRWGEVNRVYAQRRDAPSGYNPAAQNKKQRHQTANFSEAWVEFTNKSLAKTVARMLNAQVIGGKKGDKWRDDIWTMRYLSGFKWEMLGEQVAYERQAHQARLRNEITRSKAEQGEYLRNVELARVLDKRAAKQATKEDGTSKQAPSTTINPSNPSNPSKLADAENKHKRAYKQRQAVDKDGMREKGMENVLGSVFG